MYSTCVFCNQALGANEVLESFPVGRRIAFDEATGRLWVVCRKCERWNLSPLDDRLEIIEECEELFSGTRMRVSTENIGLARLSEGLELVRIGRPMRPEFAAWRYGDQFGRRRKRMMVKSTIAIAGMGALWGGAAVAGVAVGGFYGFSHNIYKRIAYGRADAIIARVSTGPARIEVKRKDLSKVRLLDGTSDSWRIEVPDGKSTMVLHGEEAQRATALLLPAMNQSGGNEKQVKEAVAMLNAARDPVSFVAEYARMPVASRGFKQHVISVSEARRRDTAPGHTMSSLPASIRLALEMATHEESERRALEGELKSLELAWKEAEEIAAISDDLFLPQSVHDMLARLRGRSV